MIAIIDYGMGNLRSVQKAFEKVGANAQITERADDIQAAEKVVLPGVGAMQPAMDKLESLNLISTIKETIRQGKPFLGICLGFQLLFERSDEGGNVEGLGIFNGNVEKFKSLKVPHMGWNQLDIKKDDCPILGNTENSSDFYFCHSYFVNTNDTNIIASTTDYGVDFVSAVSKGNTFGVQFHPEKSQNKGLKVLEKFSKL